MKLKPKTARPAEGETGAPQDVEAVMKKYDRESNVRVWEGTPRTVMWILGAAFSVYCIWVTLFSNMMPEEKLNIFLGLVLILGYLHYPVRKGHTRVNHIPWYDVVLAIVGGICYFFYPLNLEAIVNAGDYPAYWEIESGDAQEVVVLFRSYTGALVRYYIDRTTGDTRVTEFVPGITPEEMPSEESLNAWDYV